MWPPLLLAYSMWYPPPDLAADPSVHIHDGFYLRLGAGVGLLVQSDASGVGVPSELSFGGTVAPGLALGVGNYGVVFPNPASERNSGQLAFNAWGPFVDYYPDPRLGAHVEASVMFVYGLSSAKGVVESAQGPGYGLMLGGGYEWWVSEQWSLGVIGRAAYYAVRLAGAKTDLESDATAFVPAVLFGATLH